jgi:hypothetical protein
VELRNFLERVLTRIREEITSASIVRAIKVSKKPNIFVKNTTASACARRAHGSPFRKRTVWDFN